MKKLLVLLGTIGLTSTAMITVIACGINNRSEVSKINLNDLKLNLTIQGTEDMTAGTAFAAFLENNQDESFDDLRESVALDFTKSDYDNDGSLIITAKPKTKYTGVITVKTKKMKKIRLIDLLNVKNPSERLIIDIDGTEAMIGDDSGQIALATFFDINKKNYPDLVDNIEITSYNNKVGYNQNGFLHIQGIKKYSGGTSVFIRNIPVTDEKIVATIINSGSIKFGATKALDQSLADFIDGVLRGGEHDDSHWYIKGQIEPYKNSFPILNYINYDKYEFVGFYLVDETTPLTDAYLKTNSEVGKVMKLRAKFNYGTVQDRFIDFSLSFQATKN